MFETCPTRLPASRFTGEHLRRALPPVHGPFRLHAHCLLGIASLGAPLSRLFRAVCHPRRAILRRFAAHAAFRQLSLAEPAMVMRTVWGAQRRLATSRTGRPASRTLCKGLCAGGGGVHHSFKDTDACSAVDPRQDSCVTWPPEPRDRGALPWHAMTAQPPTSSRPWPSSRPWSSAWNGGTCLWMRP
jgi:hypothetical protein